MTIIKEHRVLIISVIAIVLMLLSVFFWNYVSKKQAEAKTENSTNLVDISDVDNVASVESKLGSDIKITQGYLLTYTVKKSSIWYMSTGVIDSIQTDGDYSIIRIRSSLEDDAYLEASILTSKCSVKKKDTVYFVGNVDLNTGMLELAKISVEPIRYNSVTEVSLSDLIANIQQVKSNFFIVNGYLVTEGENYKIYDTKEAYTTDSSFGHYFSVTWEEEFPYTGNQSVSIKCQIGDTYKLRSCALME